LSTCQYTSVIDKLELVVKISMNNESMYIKIQDFVNQACGIISGVVIEELKKVAKK